MAPNTQPLVARETLCWQRCRNGSSGKLPMVRPKRLASTLSMLVTYAMLAACGDSNSADYAGGGFSNVETAGTGSTINIGDSGGVDNSISGGGGSAMMPGGGSFAGVMSTGGVGAAMASGGTTSSTGGVVDQDAAVDGGSGGTATAASTEDDGADCMVGSLPDPGSLPSISKLPDPFEKLDGTRMSQKSEWRCRREEIKRMAETYALGEKPSPPQSVSGSVSETSISIQVMDNSSSASFSVSVQLPSGGQAPYPSIVVYGGGGFGAPLDSSVINSEGIALINYNPYDVGAEGTPRNNKQGAFYDLYGSTSTTGLLIAWGWGVSRIIDVIERSDGSILQADAVAVTGCSRFGKGAFVAGVFDQRIPLTMPIESGTAGVPIWRGISGEGAQSLSSAYGEQPWFGDAFGAFTSDPTKAPIDTHELVAMVAPRGLFIMDNPYIANLGPISAHVAALAGAEVYAALGASDSITYWSDVQSGSHCSLRPEWSAPLKSNIQRFLTKTGSDPGVIQASAQASGDLAQWRDWATPTLQ